MANDPKAAKSDVCGWPMTLSAKANTAGMTIAARAALLSAAEFSTAGDHTPGRAGNKRAKKGRPGRCNRAANVLVTVHATGGRPYGQGTPSRRRSESPQSP